MQDKRIVTTKVEDLGIDCENISHKDDSSEEMVQQNDNNIAMNS